MNKKLNIVMLANHKGGVTKTTSCYVLSELFSRDSHSKIYKPHHKRKGSKTLVIDLDSQANLTSSILSENQLETLQGGVFEAITTGDATPYVLQSETNPNLYILPATASISQFDIYFTKYLEDKENPDKFLEKSLVKVIENLDIENILIDTAPASSLLLKQGGSISFGNPTNLVVPFALSKYSLDSLVKIADSMNGIAATSNPNIRLAKLLPVLLKKRTKNFTETLTDVREVYGDLVSESVILDRTELENLSDEGFSEEFWQQRKALEMYYDFFNELKGAIKQ